MERIETMLESVPLFRGLSADERAVLAGCAGNVRFEEGDVLFREGDPANTFYVIRHGSVALETFVPARGSVMIDTIDAGEVLGWSWLFPPYRWHLDARAISRVRATAFDGACLREKCEANPALGFEIVKRCAADVEERLYRAWHQIVDVYGPVGS